MQQQLDYSEYLQKLITLCLGPLQFGSPHNHGKKRNYYFLNVCTTNDSTNSSQERLQDTPIFSVSFSEVFISHF